MDVARREALSHINVNTQKIAELDRRLNRLENGP
jgi:hypothetical protein